MSRRGRKVIVSGGTRLDTTVSPVRYIEGGSSEYSDERPKVDTRRYGVVGIPASEKRIVGKKRPTSNKVFLFSSSTHDEIKRILLRQRDEKLRKISSSNDECENSRNSIINMYKKKISRLRRFDFGENRLYVKRNKVMSGFIAFRPTYIKAKDILVFEGMLDGFIPTVSRKGEELFNVHLRINKVKPPFTKVEKLTEEKYDLKDLYPYSVAEIFMSYLGMYSFDDIKLICSRFESYHII